MFEEHLVVYFVFDGKGQSDVVVSYPALEVIFGSYVLAGVEELADGIPETVGNYSLVLLETQILRPLLHCSLSLTLPLTFGDAADYIVDHSAELDCCWEHSEGLVEGGRRFRVLYFVDVGLAESDGVGGEDAGYEASFMFFH